MSGDSRCCRWYSSSSVKKMLHRSILEIHMERLFEMGLLFLRGYKCCFISSQAVEWLGELLDALLKTHIRLGDDSQETKVLLEKHKKFVDVAQVFEMEVLNFLF